MSITLEDVKIAIKILDEFVRQYREAERVLRQFRAFQTTTVRSASRPEDFIKMAYEMAKSREAKTEEEKEEELTEEELQRIREIRKKIEEGKAQPVGKSEIKPL